MSKKTKRMNITSTISATTEMFISLPPSTKDNDQQNEKHKNESRSTQSAAVSTNNSAHLITAISVL
jgi:hypothetical protein